MDLTTIALSTGTAKIWTTLTNPYWNNSLFETFKNFSSRKKGTEGEHLTADILELLGSTVQRNKHGKPCKPKGSKTDFDIIIDNHKVEVKCSTAWEEKENKFVWQQLRSLQEYDRVIFVGINPNKLHMW
jgi:hypothetical protein